MTVEFIDFKRRRLVGALSASGLVLASPAFAQLPAAPKKATTTDEEAIPATEDLMREHGVAERILLIYEAGIRRIGDGEDIEPAIFTQTGEIMRDFIHGYHEKSEEDQIFPRFKKAGRMVDLVDTLIAQHAEGRKLTDKFLQVAATPNTEDKRKTMIDTMKATITLYRPHLAREDTDLFPTVRSLVTPKEFDEISEAMEKAERDKFGADGFEKTVKKVAAIEKRIGMNDLSQAAKPKN
ncbi:MAG TPA: hemerythrin domain-containing protein [Reyranella sp.]|jgi:hemerythrin-like domain-containing protein|nr:hemerythrin domain-containing protein [Reyranella sp.]